MRLMCVLLCVSLVSPMGFAAEGPIKAQNAAKAPKKSEAPQPTPTHANVPYGTHPRQVLDFWRAGSPAPTPLVFHIHGGGWVNGDKARVASLERYLAAGISVVSINYRFVTHAMQAGVNPPVQWPLEDAARALQFVRSKSREWNLDSARVGATGGSAGACSSLYLAFHPDLADATSRDLVARQSTRLWCAAVSNAQTTLDPEQMKAWTPNSRYGGHAFGFMPDAADLRTRDTQFDEFLANRESVLPWIKKYSPFEHVSRDDPPVYLIYATPPAKGQTERDPTHSANFGVLLQERLDEVGVANELVYPGAPDVKHAAIADFLIETLKARPRR